MSEIKIAQVHPQDKFMLEKIDALLQKEGIKKDANLDYICAIYNEDYEPICTGSLYKNTLRCFAVDENRQGEGLLNQIISHLIQVQYERGNSHLFLYTKLGTVKFFSSLGFYEIARVSNSFAFMENHKDGFHSYLNHLRTNVAPSDSAAIVMNANPFTLGHQYLVEYAASRCEHLHLFIVSEDRSLVPFSVRKKLVELGTSHIKNLSIHDSGAYIISNATFPSYFLKDEEDIIKNHAELDITVFSRIANALHIKTRYVGEEPHSIVTGLYNQIMLDKLQKADISCQIIPRKTYENQPISASTVRSLIQKGDIEGIRHLVPKSTYSFFLSEEAKPVIQAIQQETNVVHY